MKAFTKISLLLLLILGAGEWLSAQNQGLVAPPYGWHPYVSHGTVVEISGIGDSIYAITPGGLILYNVATDKSQEFTTVDGLSGVDATALLADPGTGRVFVGFSDGMINYFDKAGELHFVTDIHRSEDFSAKRINRFFSKDGMLYVAVDFGMVVYDILRQETRYAVTKIANNPTGSVVKAVAVSGDKIWAAMGSLGVWSADLAAAPSTLPGVWTKESGQAGLPDGTVSSLCANGDLVFALVEDTIFQKILSQPWTRSNFPIGDWNYLNASSGNVYGTFLPSKGAVLYPDSNLIVLDNQGSIKCNYIHKFGGMLIGDRFAGLQFYKISSVGLVNVGLPGPKNNQVVDLAAHGGGLYIAPKGRVGSSARGYDKSGIPYYNLHDEGWEVSDFLNGALTVGDVYQDFYRVVIDTATDRCMVGSWGEGIVEMLDGEVVRTYTSANSGLPHATVGHLVSGLAFDGTGNLWVSQYLNDFPLSVLTSDGQWHSYQSPYQLNAFGVMADYFGNKWIINNGAGLVVFNDNYTPDNLADDRWRTLTTAYGNGSLPNSTVNCIVQDHDFQVWIGTSEGITVMYDPTLLWTTDFQDAACPIIEGYCLFRDQQVNDIAVDGFNRKWIATDNGVFLVNLDGTEVLKHFTKSNSPLFDDVVVAVAIDGYTGEVFFGTAKGVVSYVGDAIDGRPQADELYAYPNPALIDQGTSVMIKGMRAYSKVKITTASGRLVRELDSQGGEVPWDMKDTFGNFVTPGIYLAFVADADGKGAGVTKIAILEKQY